MSRSAGILGENIAVSYLTKKGYKILDRNFQTKFGEIDIIATERECIVFVEVKMRSSDVFGIPASAVTWEKLNKIIISAEFYLKVNKKSDLTWRIDVVEIILPKNMSPIVRHLENVTM